MTSPVLAYAAPGTMGYRGERAAWVWACIWYSIAGFAIPATDWAFGAPRPLWQSGWWQDRIELLLSLNVSWPLLPFQALSMICLVLLLIRREFFGRFLVVRLGIYTGVLQAIAFAGVVLLAGDGGKNKWIGLWIGGIGDAVVVVAGGCVVVAWLLVRRFGWLAFGIAAGAAVVVGLGSIVAGVGVLGVLGGGPAASALAYGCMSWWLLRDGPASRTNAKRAPWWCWIPAWGLWVMPWVGAWTWAIMRAIDAYNRLPTTPPDDCYITSAAARGHMGIVKSEVVRFADGTTGRVNEQLRTLKAGELASAVVWPRGHRAMRRIYDALGPMLARRMRHPWLADMAYLMLKPTELATRVGLRALGVPERAVRRLYR